MEVLIKGQGSETTLQSIQQTYFSRVGVIIIPVPLVVLIYKEDGSKRVFIKTGYYGTSYLHIRATLRRTFPL